MLKLVEIIKDYPMKDQEPVHALKGLTVNFRRNEFVAILGPSGCGKTTLLNIIGGLDRYTSGDLIIEGKSTKNYKDGDWDTYRNHSIGFVFQSYNLIQHQSIIKNVELALTIGGISKDERRERAIKALEKVGLQGLEKKKPNQLSGGQMQRVAIARALINEPEILLADEPTGALDSETSIQIMDLLKEVSKDCLVIMVTHNPDLANAYANRIIKMKDGLLLSDTNPYSDEQESLDHKKDVDTPIEKSNKGNKKKSSMSFFTATGLSFSNLLSKLKRTILVAIAGSIGIIGVSSVLAVSYGVRNYISDMQDDMLSNYPLTISEKSVDLASLMSGLSNWDSKVISDFDPTTEVGLDSMIRYLMDKYKDIFSVKQNDINEELISYIGNNIDKKYISSISYDHSIDVTNNIFTAWDRGRGDKGIQNISLNALTQMYISELSTVPDFGQYSMFVNLFTDFMKQLPGDEEFILSQYDLLGNSQMAKEANEIMLVVDDNQTLTDLVYAQMGFYTEKEFINISQKAIKVNEGTLTPEDEIKYSYPEKYTFDDILGKKLYYVPDIYEYGTIDTDQLRFVIDLSALAGGDATMSNVEFNLEYNKSGDLISGTGMGLPLVLTRAVGDKPADDNPTPWVGMWSGDLSFYSEALEQNVKIPYVINLKDDGKATLSAYISNPPYVTPEVDYVHIDNEINAYKYNGIIDDITAVPGAQEVVIKGILKKKPNVNFGSLSRGVYFTPALTKKYINDTKNTDVIASEDTSKRGLASYITNSINETFEAYVTYTFTSFAKGEDDNVVEDVVGYANTINSDLRSSLSSMISIGTTSAVDNNRAALRSLSGLSAKKNRTGQYVIGEYPQTISIYPKDFASKRQVNKMLDDWNADKDITITLNGAEKTLKPDQREELTYTDTVEMIITVINTMINVITIALVAFSSLALVVSCFMIAVITYISTMERVKEIGVIRSLGGRKKDVSRLFIAECLIIGLASGLIGIGVTYLLSLILNIVITSLNVGVTTIAALPLLVALIMIALSVFLNVISGLIPSMKASHQDPVVALRSE